MKIFDILLLPCLVLISILSAFNVYAADQSICHAGANVSLYDNGVLKSCQLENDYNTYDITCKGASTISFFNNGNLESCVLARPATIDGTKCKENGLISFYSDGKLKSCLKPEE